MNLQGSARFQRGGSRKSSAVGIIHQTNKVHNTPPQPVMQRSGKSNRTRQIRTSRPGNSLLDPTAEACGAIV
jgi:hypothetical protein